MVMPRCNISIFECKMFFTTQVAVILEWRHFNVTFKITLIEVGIKISPQLNGNVYNANITSSIFEQQMYGRYV